MKIRSIILLVGMLTCFQWASGADGVNSLYIPPLEASESSQINVPIHLSNEADIVALQFDLQLPNSLDIDSRKQIELTERKKDHIISIKNKGGKSYMVVVYSMTNSAFRGSTGALINVPIVIPGMLEVGSEHTFTLENVVLSKRNGENVSSTAVNDGILSIIKRDSPDVEPYDISLSSENMEPNGEVYVKWSVRNVGSFATGGGWKENIYLVDEHNNEVFLGNSICDDLLQINGSVVREATFTIPEQVGIDGEVSARVKLNPFSDLGEHYSETSNNTATSTSTLVLKKLLFAKMNQGSIRENQTSGVYGFVYRSGSRATEETVSLSNSNSERLVVPESVTIPQGESGASFVIKAVDNSIANQDSSAVITASMSGYEDCILKVWIIDNERPSLSITVADEVFEEGDVITMTLSREWASGQDLAVRLHNDHNYRFDYEDEIVIPANETSVEVPITVVDDSKPGQLTDAQFSMTAQGYNPSTAMVTVIDDDTPDITMEIKPSTFSEASGPQAAMAIVRRTGVTNNQIRVDLSYDFPNSLYLPFRSFTMPKGLVEYQFPIGAINNTEVDGERTVMFTASVYLESCSCAAQVNALGSTTQALTLLDDDGPTLSAKLSQSTMLEGQTNATELIVSRNTETNEAITVHLSSDHPEDIAMPETVVIPVGEKSTKVDVSINSNDVSEGNRTVVFTVSAENFVQGTTWGMITDMTLADAIVEEVHCDKSEYDTKSSITVGATIKNIGAAAIPELTKVAIYLTNNADYARASEKEFLGDLYTQSDIEVGESTSLSHEFILPDKTGDYYVIAYINEKQYMTELSYLNNTARSEAIELLPLYAIESITTDKTNYNTGDSILIEGTIIGSKKDSVALDLYLINNGQREVAKVTTDSEGLFSYKQRANDWQKGKIAIGACYPDEGLTAEQVVINVYGLRKKMFGYKDVTLDFLVDEIKNYSFEIENLSQVAQTNIQVEVLSKPEYVEIEFESIERIDGLATASLNYTIESRDISVGDYEKIRIRVFSDEGADFRQDIYMFASTLQPLLRTSHPSINTTMLKGAKRFYNVEVWNEGLGETGNMEIHLPDNAPWLSLATPKNLPSLKSGDTTTVVLCFEPSGEMVAQTNYYGNFVVSPTVGKGLSIKYDINVVSEAKGELVVAVCDELTYHTVDAPKLAGAKIKIKHPFTHKLITEGTSDENGMFRTDLFEGYYRIEVEADKHDAYANNILIDPGKENNLVVDLFTSLIIVDWKVERIEIEDSYEIITTAVYETNVPRPVITMYEPDSIPWRDHVFKVIFTNQGLVAAYDLRLMLPEIPNASFEVLGESSIDTLAAHSSTVFHVKFSVFNDTQGGPQRSIAGCFVAAIQGFYRMLCGPGDVTGGVKGRNHNFGPHADCDLSIPGLVSESISNNVGGPPSKQGGDSSIGAGGGGGGGFGSGASIGDCDKCVEKILGAVLDCAGFGPLPMSMEEFFLKEFEMLPIPGLEEFMCLVKLNNALSDCYGAGPIIPGGGDDGNGGGDDGNGGGDDGGGDGGDTPDGDNGGNDGGNPGGDDGGNNGGGDGGNDGGGNNGGGNDGGNNGGDGGDGGGDNPDRDNPNGDNPDGDTNSKYSYAYEYALERIIFEHYVSLYSDMLIEVYGDSTWFDYGRNDKQLLEEMDRLQKRIKELNPRNNYITFEELAHYKPMRIGNSTLERLVDRCNNTRKMYLKEEYDATNCLDTTYINGIVQQIDSINQDAKDLGYESEVDRYNAAREKVMDYANSMAGAGSVCATITLQFRQEMTMTREAFRGTLSIDNGYPTDMKEIKLDLQVFNSRGEMVGSEIMHVEKESIEDMQGDLNGTWSVGAEQKGVATILFIPTVDAAPTLPENYSFGGILTYKDPASGLMVERVLMPVVMKVNPSPLLRMTYFMQRDILGDNALTEDVIEPMEEAEFSVLIHNVGAGDAKNINMVTHQPEIIENEKGLMIDFEMISSQLNGQERVLALGESVSTPFGNIAAGDASYAQWWITSTLLGHFIDYKIEATHLSSRGNPNLSLLDTISIHELIRSIQVPNSTLAGFLVNDITDTYDTPDMMYLSDGTIEEVYHVDDYDMSIQKVMDNTYDLTISNTSKGWGYGSIPSPAHPRQKIERIIRKSDGVEISTRNIWTTEFTILDSTEPIEENILHFVVKKAGGSETYTIIFEPRPDEILLVESFEGIPNEEELATVPVSNVAIVFNKDIDASTFTYEDLKLLFEGEVQDLSDVAIQKVSNNTFIVNLSQKTKRNGYYVLSVQTAEIVDCEGFKGELGKSTNWVQYLADNLQTLTYDLSEGWNWISCNVKGYEDPQNFIGVFEGNTQRLRSQSEELNNDPTMGLQGDLATLDIKDAYKLQTNKDCAISLTGTIANTNEHQIRLNIGWNWITYLPNISLSVSDALAGLAAQKNDEIKGQTGFAVYDGTKWVGTLKTLVPGEGYLYFSHGTKSFYYPEIDANYALRHISKPVFRAAKNTASETWVVDRHKHPNNMSAIVSLSFEEEQVEIENYTIAAFVGEECRGISELVAGTENVLFMTISTSDAAEEITFKAIITDDTNQIFDIEETISASDISMGSLESPYALNLIITNPTSIENPQTGLSIYPTLCKDKIYIRGNLDGIEQLIVADLEGRVVKVQRNIGTANVLDVSELHNGVYILIIPQKDEMVYRQFIKREE